MYDKPNPWQPSPMIVSIGPSIMSSLKSAPTILDEWDQLAFVARRNVPILVVGPELQLDKGWDEATLAWVENIRTRAIKGRIELLEVSNLTLGIEGFGGFEELGARAGMEVALVEAMMVINWLRGWTRRDGRVWKRVGLSTIKYVLYDFASSQLSMQAPNNDYWTTSRYK